MTARWKKLKQNGTITALATSIFFRGNELRLEQIENFIRRPILNTWVWPNRGVFGSYEGGVVALNGWLRGRIDWMDVQFGP